MVSRPMPFMPAPITKFSSVVTRPDLHSDDINRLRDQLWYGLYVTAIIVTSLGFVAFRVMNDSLLLPSLLIAGPIVIGCCISLYLHRTHYSHFAQRLYVLVIHLSIPSVLIFFGGTRGYGDLGILVSILVALLYGWRRWMVFTFGVMAITMVWVLYQDILGNLIAPLFIYSPQFIAVKFFVLMLAIVLLVRYFVVFYQGLLDKYQHFAEEQVRLNRELQRSRQQLVTAREEERRRLRRDLHDGLGPTLAAQMFRVGIAQNLLEKNPEKTATMLHELQTEIEGTLTHIRELVYELRPPMLDQLGLNGAISDFVSQVDTAGKIKLSLPPQLLPLNAAVEVAAFRIMQTALDNVIKHAQATACDARLTMNEDHLHIEIVDNGVGIAEKYRAGVGLTSMRERAEELGGVFAIAPIQPHGTRLSVSLPLLQSS